jgi:hypothetical protein
MIQRFFYFHAILVRMFGRTEKFSTAAQEHAHLAAEAQKGYLLQEQPGITHQEAAREAISKYAQAEAKEFLHETKVLPEHEMERIVLRLKPEAHDEKIEELFGLMLEKGIKNALDIARKLNDPHLEDDFHRFLVQYFHTIGAIPGLKEESTLARELKHTLFTVALPPMASTDEKAEFKRFIQAMKQFYAGMVSVGDWNEKQYYTLELAVQNKGRDIALYASVPSLHVATFEKLIHAYYPGAAIEEAVDDYNIFSPAGSAIAGATASLAEPAIFPLSTDETFEHDPLAALIGSLSRLEQEGEGGAIQIVITSDVVLNNKLYQGVIEQAEKGEGTVKDLYTEATRTLFTDLGKGFLSFFEKEKPKEEEKEKKVDTHGIELAKQKNQSQSISAGIRIIATASTLPRAQSILSTMKATFNQFALVASNRIAWNDIKTASILDYAKDFSFRTFDLDIALPLTINELATLFHFPVGLVAAPELVESPAASAPAPRVGQDGIYLGTNTFQGEASDIYLSPEDRVRHCYVIGQTGTGKTTILKNMAIQDIKAGNGVCFIDPHGSDLNDILANIPQERLDDVIYFDPAYTARPMGLNMLEYNPDYPEQKIFVINELLAIFNKLFDMKVAGGPAFEQYFRNAAGLVMEDPASGSTLLEIGRVMSDKAFRELKLSRCQNPIIKQFWQNAEKTTGEQSLANFVPYITNKFDVFVSNDIMRPVIAQQESVLNFRKIMDEKKILLVNLSKGRLGDINSALIGLILVGKISMAALSRVDIVGKEQVNDFYLYIDEFQNVTTDSISTILSEARKYRLSLTVAHQYIEQLQDNIKDAVFGNVGNMIVYRVSPENAEVFEKQFSPTFTASDITKLENFNAYAKILVHGMPAKPFNLRIPPPPKGNMEIAEKVKELSYLKYGRPREEIEAEILARFQ